MEKSARKGLHERSSSKNNELPVLGPGGFCGGQVSEKEYHHPSLVSTRPPMTPTKSKNAAKPRTPNTPSSLASSSISLSSLPPVPPLHINKIPPLSVKKQKKSATPLRKTGLEEFFYAPAQERRPAVYIDSATRSASNSTVASSDTPSSSAGPRPLPNPVKPILKKSRQLPPYTVEEYEEKRNSWVERNSSQAQNYARMNGRSLRIVRDEDEYEDVSESSLAGPSRQTSPTLLVPPQSPRPLSPAYIPPSSPTKQQPQSRSNSLLRTSSLLRPSSSKGIPSWARYFYSRGEDLVPMDEEAGPVSESDSLAITPLQPAHYRPPTAGLRTRYDPEVVTQWSYPHLDRATYPISKTEQLKNRQVILFCLGFLLPLLWIVAALLPLPGPKPTWTIGKRRKSELGVDFERTLSNCSAEHERYYRYSKFWRRVNRAMSIVGVLIIGAVITLVVVATQS